ncbi:MAG: CPBP family intramembrane glutamic endopeptidase [Acutalibacteraceae bacterium]|nr:CPBP family intramembrane glutamic endopeptidase [Acutalibacteraceae bacterium]
MNNFNNNTGVPNYGNPSQPTYNNQDNQGFTPNCGYGIPLNQRANQQVNYNYRNLAMAPPVPNPVDNHAYNQQSNNNQFNNSNTLNVMPNISGYNLEKIKQDMKIAQEKESIKKVANRSAGGLLIFSLISEGLAIILIMIIMFTGAYNLDNSDYISGIEPVTMYILNSLMCLVGFGLSGLIITKFNKLRLDDVLSIKKVNVADTVKFTIASMGFVYVFNLLLSFMNMNLSLFGFENEASDFGTVTGLWGNAIYFISVAMVPPIIEEFVFRGAILGSIRPKHGDALAIIISAVLFGFMHGNFIQTPVTFLTGLVLGYLTVKTNSIIPAIILHFVNNAWAVVYDILSNATSEDTMLLAESGVALVLIGVGLICAVSLIKKYKNDLFTFEKPESEFTMSQKLRYSFTTPCMILFTISTIATCILTATTA